MELENSQISPPAGSGPNSMGNGILPTNAAFGNNNNNGERVQSSGRVLLASVTNLVYPVDINLIHYLFSKYGMVEKIVGFSRSPSMYQALVEFDHVNQAKNAMRELHNRNIYDSCNSLQVQVSHLDKLQVKYNTEKAWDFRVDPDGPATPMSGAPGPGYDNRNFNKVPKVPQNGPYAQNRNFPPSPFHSLPRIPREIRELDIEYGNPNQTPVVIVYKLNPSTTIEMLFNLFSMYGVVLRIKILRDKPDTALVQFSDPLYATIAQKLMSGVVIGSQAIQVELSKNMEVKMPMQNPNTDASATNGETSKKTAAFTHRDQRYGYEDVEKYIKGACRPTRTLFVASIDDSTNEATLRELFSKYGTITKFAFKDPKSETVKVKMALLEMEQETEAIDAVMNLHNNELNGRTIKVAFSKTLL